MALSVPAHVASLGSSSPLPLIPVHPTAPTTAPGEELSLGPSAPGTFSLGLLLAVPLLRKSLSPSPASLLIISVSQGKGHFLTRTQVPWPPHTQPHAALNAAWPALRSAGVTLCGHALPEAGAPGAQDSVCLAHWGGPSDGYQLSTEKAVNSCLSRRVTWTEGWGENASNHFFFPPWILE